MLSSTCYVTYVQMNSYRDTLWYFAV